MAVVNPLLCHAILHGMKWKTQITVLVPNYPGAVFDIIDRIGRMPSFYLPESNEGTYGPMRAVFDTDDEADAFMYKLKGFHCLKKTVLAFGAREASEVFLMFRAKEVNIHYISKIGDEYVVYVTDDHLGRLAI